MPPTAGTARFENDIESWSSAVRTSGSGIGTVPISEIAVAKFVRNEMTRAAANHAQVGVLDRLVELLGITDLAEQGEHGDERADRHQQVGGVDAVELLERRRLGPDRGRCGLPQRAQLLLALLALRGACAAASRGSAPRTEGRGARR